MLSGECDIEYVPVADLGGGGGGFRGLQPPQKVSSPSFVEPR